MRRLAGLRVTAGLTQMEVANRLGVTQGAVSIWERCEGRPNLNKITLLANLYGVEVNEIVEACMCKPHNIIITGKERLDND